MHAVFIFCSDDELNFCNGFKKLDLILLKKFYYQPDKTICVLALSVYKVYTVIEFYSVQMRRAFTKTNTSREVSIYEYTRIINMNLIAGDINLNIAETKSTFFI